MILLLYAHPHPRRSTTGRVLIDAVRDLPQLTVHALYDVYPDFSIDAVAERERLAGARLVIWQHPFYWYGAPALLNLWFESVLVRGWAHGEGGNALRGKDCLWVTTTGAPPEAYCASGAHEQPFAAFEPPMQQTALFCGMNWLAPIVVHGAHRLSEDALQAQARGYRARLEAYLEDHG